MKQEADFGPEPQRPEPAQRRLTRSRDDRMIGGVCAGLARYLGLDPTLVRVAFALLGVMGGGFLLYIILWIVVPEAEPGEQPAAVHAASSDVARYIIGGILVAAGSIALIGLVIPEASRYFWPAAVIVAGLALVYSGGKR
jgi:phage shock protein C